MTPFTIPYNISFSLSQHLPLKSQFLWYHDKPFHFFYFSILRFLPPFFSVSPSPFLPIPLLPFSISLFYDDGKKWEIFSWKLFSLSAKKPSLGLLLFNSWEFFAACSLQAPSLSIFVTVVWGIVFFCRLYNFSKVFLSWTLTHKSCLPYAKLGAFVLETSGWQPPPFLFYSPDRFGELFSGAFTLRSLCPEGYTRIVGVLFFIRLGPNLEHWHQFFLYV